MSPGLVAARKMTFVRRERWHTKSPVSQKEHDETPRSSAEACELRTTAHPGTSLTPRGTKLFGTLSDFPGHCQTSRGTVRLPAERQTLLKESDVRQRHTAQLPQLRCRLECAQSAHARAPRAFCQKKMARVSTSCVSSNSLSGRRVPPSQRREKTLADELPLLLSKKSLRFMALTFSIQLFQD